MDLDKAMSLRSRRMEIVSLRIPKEVVDFYKQYPNSSAAMRHVLTEHVAQTMEEDELENNNVISY